ncbi:hypothetical protein SM033_00053 [Vibrio phage vB_VpaM_sm033]|nr:hypothetical protein SM033_00053 [Vibrio phage vB_VpaM_sm033]
MTTIVAINGYLAADQNHASYQNLPRYVAQKMHASEHNSIMGAIYGDSTSLAELYQMSTLLEIYMHRCRTKDEELKEKCAEAADMLKKIVGHNDFLAIQKCGEDILTIHVADGGVDLPWREDGIAFGTGCFIAKAMYHIQKQNDEFDIREIMGHCIAIDPQTGGGYTVCNGETLFDARDLTDDDIRKAIEKAM